MQQNGLQRIDYVPMDRFRELVSDETLLALLSFWEKNRNADGLFLRDKLDPANIRELLPNIFIMDVLDAGRRFRYRLVGTYIQERIGRKIDGLLIDEFRSGALASHLNTLFGTSVRTAVPGLGHSTLPGESSPLAKYCRLALPMSSDGKKIDQVLGGWVSTYETKDPLAKAAIKPDEDPGTLIFAAPESVPPPTASAELD